MWNVSKWHHFSKTEIEILWNPKRHIKLDVACKSCSKYSLRFVDFVSSFGKVWQFIGYIIVYYTRIVTFKCHPHRKKPCRLFVSNNKTFYHIAPYIIISKSRCGATGSVLTPTDQLAWLPNGIGFLFGRIVYSMPCRSHKPNGSPPNRNVYFNSGFSTSCCSNPNRDGDPIQALLSLIKQLLIYISLLVRAFKFWLMTFRSSCDQNVNAARTVVVVFCWPFKSRPNDARKRKMRKKKSIHCEIWSGCLSFPSSRG